MILGSNSTTGFVLTKACLMDFLSKTLGGYIIKSNECFCAFCLCLFNACNGSNVTTVLNVTLNVIRISARPQFN